MRIVGNFTVPILAAAGLAAAAVAQADDFRIQAQLAYDQVDFEDFDEDVDAISARGTFYFKPVPTDGVPVGEAAYIARSSYAEVIGVWAESGDESADAFAANLGYHFTDTAISMLFARVGVVDSDDGTDWNGTLGIVPIPRLFFGTDFDEDGYDPNLTARYAGKLANEHWWAGSVNIVDVEDGDTDVGVEFDYYFPSFKLGGGFNSGGDRWTGRAEFGLPAGFALQGSIFTADGADGFGIQLTWRDL